MSDNGYGSDSDDDSAPGMFPEATNRSWSVEKLVLQLLNNGRIDLEAEYQRGAVWKGPAQAALIDSVYRNAPVSQLIFAKYVVNDRELWRCVDGKQRLTALQKFLAGEISFRDKASKTNYWFIDTDLPPNNNRKARAKTVFSERQRENFLAKEIQCVVYNKLRPEQERDIFSRLQCGSPLTSAERIKAVFTSRTNMAREFQTMFLNNPSSPLHANRRNLGLNRARETPFRYLICILHALDTDQIRLLAKTDAWIFSDAPLKHGIKANMQAAMEVYEAIADTSDALVTIAPVQFLVSVIFVHRYRQTATLEALIEAIREMDADVRAKHPKEVKSTKPVFATMSDFMEQWSAGPGNRLKEGEVNATEQARLIRLEARDNPRPVPAPAPKPRPRAGAKRKEREVDEERASRGTRTKAGTGGQDAAIDKRAPAGSQAAPACKVESELQFVPNGLLGGSPGSFPCSTLAGSSILRGKRQEEK